MRNQEAREEQMQTETNDPDQAEGQDMRDEFMLLRSTIVTDDTMNLIKDKLRMTAEYRLQLLEDQNLDLLENFPYFFTNPELVR